MPAASGHARETCNRSTRLPRLPIRRLLMPAPLGLIRMQPAPTTSATTASALAAAATRAAAPPMRPVGPLVVTCCARRAQGSWRPCIRHLQASSQQVVVDVLPCRLALALALPLAFGITMRRLFHEACGTTMQRCLGGPRGVWVKTTSALPLPCPWHPGWYRSGVWPAWGHCQGPSSPWQGTRNTSAFFFLWPPWTSCWLTAWPRVSYSAMVSLAATGGG